MAVALSLTLTGLKKNKTKTSLMTKIQAKAVLISVILLVLMLIITSLYFIQINVLASQGYHFNEYKENLARLQEKNKQLELQVAELQSRQVILEKIADLGLVKVVQVDYLSPSGSSVAVR